MAINSIVNRYGSQTEKQLLDDLTAEAIQTAGVDVLYLPRVDGNMDETMLEDPLHRFTTAHEIEMYVANYQSFMGDGHFLDQAGIRITDEIKLKVSTKRFREVLKTQGLSRPREGDLVFFPLDRRMFEIKFVDKWPEFYPINHLPSFDMRCELFEYSGQRFSTGIDDIDAVMGHFLGTDADTSLPDVDAILDPLDDRARIQAEANAILDFSELDPWSEGQY